ncbi:hypothetical protein [Micromonospora tarensis]|uniref:Lsr2 protein n=1 Tax=Micromonospora tarensis TaxID=2806100 RepID=A0ABS1YCL8_9ACTN|nr:hypothetical protein [Micromonospora tarensis]MBM0275100.1 hypothetical protein [Micromonospora tarensis]
MAEKTIIHGSFWYIDDEGLHQSAVRGDKVDITRDEDLKRGERHGAFATDEDLAPGSDFRAFVDRRAAAGAPGIVTVDPADVEGRISPAGSADPRIQSGLVDPAGVPGPSVRPQTGPEVPDGGGKRPSVNAPKAEWVAYHVEQRPDDLDEGTARAQAEAMTLPVLKQRAGVDYHADAPPQV